jgi:hypothetical protein
VDSDPADHELILRFDLFWRLRITGLKAWLQLAVFLLTIRRSKINPVSVGRKE